MTWFSTMTPPTQILNLDVEAISGICGLVYSVLLSSIDAEADSTFSAAPSPSPVGASLAPPFIPSQAKLTPSSSRRLLSPDHPEFPTQQRRCPFHSIHHRLATWRCLQYSGCCPAGRPADHGTISRFLPPSPKRQLLTHLLSRSFSPSTIRSPISSSSVSAFTIADSPGATLRPTLRNRPTRPQANPMSALVYCQMDIITTSAEAQTGRACHQLFRISLKMPRRKNPLSFKPWSGIPSSS